MERKKSFLLHRLVWMTFRGDIPEGLQINHKNEDKTNNSLDNLELVTPKENSNYGSHNRRVAEKLSKPVLQFSKFGEFIKEYPGFIEAWRQTGISRGNICQCCRGKPKSSGGYVWRYKT